MHAGSTASIISPHSGRCGMGYRSIPVPIPSATSVLASTGMPITVTRPSDEPAAPLPSQLARSSCNQSARRPRRVGAAKAAPRRFSRRCSGPWPCAPAEPPAGGKASHPRGSPALSGPPVPAGPPPVPPWSSFARVSLLEQQGGPPGPRAGAAAPALVPLLRCLTRSLAVPVVPGGVPVPVPSLSVLSLPLRRGHELPHQPGVLTVRVRHTGAGTGGGGRLPTA